MQQKEISKADMKKKVLAWQTVCEATMQGQNKFMEGMHNELVEKEALVKVLKEKSEKGEATNDEGAELLYQLGYLDCLKKYLKKAE